jgi:hypothetical protein
MTPRAEYAAIRNTTTHLCVDLLPLLGVVYGFL